ncbi:MAG: hypothetical protein KJ057_14325 [Phycisphaerae bacterium]|nr:MAG: hypothetical protein EDS66_08275 [Planctomycetota bacterium]KAB2937497.1 MAG: hypothetical protein F9K17_16100 [Phycisphaerae bacterium]MBE7458824.1 hypothetical protein [Planctomycetia bacterium]MCK6465855.1 hypothetical protein [Phycisphaerae bacterium]MCL4719642.1 hypothetical protein [Phycisphaerae bacterium]
MIWLLATRGAATVLRESPFTETVIEGVYAVVYRPGVELVAQDGGDAAAAPLGTYARGLHRVSGFVYAWHGSAAEELLAIEDEIDLVIRYRAGNGESRKRTLQQAMFGGDATVTFPNLSSGLGGLVSVPFRLQIAEGDTLSDRIADEAE